MDPRQQNQDPSGANAQRPGTNYNFNGSQNDPFHAFVHTDNDGAFDNTWSNQSIPPQSQPINGFDESNHPWAQDYQSSDFLGAPNYGAPSRGYDQSYTRSPSSFNYTNFDSSHSHGFPPHAYVSQSSYDNTLGAYNGPSLNPSAQYEYPEPSGPQRNHQTISPQALQNYPASFAASGTDDGRHVSLPRIFCLASSAKFHTLKRAGVSVTV